MDQLTRSPSRARAGMTLVEVMLATVLLSFGLLAMLALQLHAMRGGQVGRHYTEAAQVARDRMELLHRLPWDHADVLPTGGWVADGRRDGHGRERDPRQTQEMLYTREYRVTADAAQPTLLRQIDVRVTWYEPNDPAAAGPAAPALRDHQRAVQRWDLTCDATASRSWSCWSRSPCSASSRSTSPTCSPSRTAPTRWSTR